MLMSNRVEFTDVDMNSDGELVIILNGYQLYRCSANASRSNLATTLSIPIGPLLINGQNTITFHNPTGAYNTLTNVAIYINNRLTVSDTTSHPLQNPAIVPTTKGVECVTYVFTASKVSIPQPNYPALRGAGGGYLMSDTTSNIATLISYWQAYLPYMHFMNFNTFRLAFSFAAGTTISLDYAKMDAIVNFLGQNGIKSILDAHTYDLKDPNIISNWQTMAAHYLSNPCVVAFEICNEPSVARQTAEMNARVYHDATVAIRQIDPNRTCVWQAPYYHIPDFIEIQDLMLPNVVYTVHKWWTHRMNELAADNIVSTAQSIVNQFLVWEKMFNVPIWLGEYGGPGGGNVTAYTPEDPTNGLAWQICRQLTIECNNNNVGWNLWCGVLLPISSKINRISPYADMIASIHPRV